MGFRLVTRIAPEIKDPAVIATLARGFLRAVVAVNRIEMQMARAKGRPFPLLYESGVRYEREKSRGYEDFADAQTVLRRASKGMGSDCEDLCAYRIAELQEQGELGADFRIYWRKPRRDGSMMMHVEVRRQDGSIEDPSRFLGL